MVRTGPALLGAALMLASVSLGTALGGEAVESGPAVGSGTSPFTVQAVTGPEKGRSLCYI
ncbi:hypothetical protein HQ576_13400 [bacterium]|nr:hypothetical protein [bacterium]